MKSSTHEVCVDGCTYMYVSPNNDTVEILDATGELVACLTWHSDAEDVCVTYYLDGSVVEDHRSSDLYYSPMSPDDVTAWAVGTHPCY